MFAASAGWARKGKMQYYWDQYLGEIGDNVTDFSPRELLRDFYGWLEKARASERTDTATPINAQTRNDELPSSG
jgi:hypothetical protein